jgi:electron-transferring-flavoprotein dehydrogenase
MASEEESFDPKSIDRESDEVDVCIVGGGAAPFTRVPSNGKI